jgi:transposase-like protein
MMQCPYCKSDNLTYVDDWDEVSTLWVCDDCGKDFDSDEIIRTDP